MLKRNFFLVCMSLVCLFSFSISAFAASQVSVEIPQGEYMADSEYVTLLDTDVLIWTVTNTSPDQDLYFSVTPRPHGWCGTVPPLAHGTVKPGETITGSKLGVDHPGHFQIRLDGPSGNATLSVK